MEEYNIQECLWNYVYGINTIEDKIPKIPTNIKEPVLLIQGIKRKITESSQFLSFFT